MTFLSVLRLFQVKTAGPMGEGGRMSLGDHFREARARLMQSILVLILATIVAFFFYNQLIDLVTNPYNDAVKALGGPHKARSQLVISGIAGGLMIQLKLCAMAGLVVSSPFWLYQIWAFIMPGLHKHERRWTRIFVVVAGPLFALGVAVGYYVLPRGIQVLISFTPANMTNLNDFKDFFSFTATMLLVFGISFEIPFFVVLLNLAGVVSGASLTKHRPWIITGTFIFAAVATPSTDPFSMLMLAIPMTLLFFLSEIIARLVDRRRRKTADATAIPDDAQSPL